MILKQLIHATFDIFDTEPRTWQLDFDEFCHWLETGERVLNSHGIMNKTVKVATEEPPKGEQSKIRNPTYIPQPGFSCSFLFPPPSLWQECHANSHGAISIRVIVGLISLR